MRNWTEATAVKRDCYDANNGRGRGNVKVTQIGCLLCRCMHVLIKNPTINLY